MTLQNAAPGIRLAAIDTGELGHGRTGRSTAICAEGLARMIGAGYSERFGICEAHGCSRVCFDDSKNFTHRVCGVTCQNRVKTAAFRSRQATRSSRRR